MDAACSRPRRDRLLGLRRAALAPWPSLAVPTPARRTYCVTGSVLWGQGGKRASRSGRQRGHVGDFTGSHSPTSCEGPALGPHLTDRSPHRPGATMAMCFCAFTNFSKVRVFMRAPPHFVKSRPHKPGSVGGV